MYKQTLSSRLLFLLLGMLFSLFSYGETQRARAFYYNVQLPSTYINRVHQDPMGYIWFATREWVSYYDGYVVRALPLPVGMEVKRDVTALCFRGNREVLIGTSVGIYVYNRINHTYTRILPNSENRDSKSNIICDFATLPPGVIYVATRNGVFYFPAGQSLSTSLFSLFPIHHTFDGEKKSERIAKVMLVDAQSDIWVGTEGDGLLCIDKEAGRTTHYLSQGSVRYHGDHIQALYQDGHGQIWVGSTRGLYVVDRGKRLLVKFSSINQAVTSIVASAEASCLLVGTESSIYKVDTRTGDCGLADGWLSGSLVNHLMVDRSSVIWIASPRGVMQYMAPNQFRVIQSGVSRSRDLSSNSISALAADTEANGVWIGLIGQGINFYSTIDTTVVRYDLADLSELNSGYLYIRALVKLADGRLLAGTDAGLISYNRQSRRFERFYFPNHSDREFENVYTFCVDRQNCLWFSVLDQGLYRYNFNKEELQFVEYAYPSDLKDIYTNIKYIYEDSNNHIWLQFYPVGVGCYNPQDGQVHLYSTESTKGLLVDNRINHLCEIENRKMLFATDRGLSMFNLATHSFETPPLSNTPIAGQGVLALLPTATRLWATTNNGIYSINKRLNDWVQYLPEDGLQAAAFSPKLAVQLGGFCFFAGDNGINTTCSDVAIANLYQPTVAVVDLLDGDVVIPTSQWLDPMGNSPSYSYWDFQNQISLLVSGFSYNNEWRNQIEYRILPLDTLWTRLEVGARQIPLAELRAGHYSVEVRGASSDAVWGPPVRVIELHIRHTWIYGSLALLILVIAMIPVFFHYKSGKIKLRKRWSKLKKLYKRPLPASQISQTLSVSPLNDQLIELMEQERLYMNKRLTKAELATRLRMTETQLSAFIKETFGQSFSEFVNGYRVRAVKDRIQDPTYRNYTYMGIAEECGFNSKTSFFRVFKEHTGETPSAYVQRVQSEVDKGQGDDSL